MQVLGIIELRFVSNLYIKLLVVFLDFAMLRFMVVHLMAQLAITYAAVLLVIVIRFFLFAPLLHAPHVGLTIILVLCLFLQNFPDLVMNNVVVVLWRL